MSTRSHFQTLAGIERKLRAFAAKGLGHLYTYGTWRLRRQLQMARPARSVLDDPTFFAQLDLGRPGLAVFREAVTHSDYETARTTLVAHFQSRTGPKFHFGWEDREGIVAAIEDKQRRATIRAAEEICQQVFRFRRMPPVRFEGDIDWAYRPEGNTDWTWDLNRHHFFATLGRAYWYTGEEKYACKFTELLLDWMARNPCRVDQVNWRSVLEVAIRVNVWIWAYHYFIISDHFNRRGHIEFLKGLLQHARYLAANIEHHSGNNHLLLEAKALAFCGLLFPEFKQAAEWRDVGLKILWEQVEKQVSEDGVHGERVPLYHWLIASELLEMMVLLKNNGIPIPDSVWDRFERMVDFQFAITKPDGSLPLFSDSALMDSHARFSPLWGGVALFGRPEFKAGLERPDEETAWVLGRERLSRLNSLAGAGPGYTSRAFHEGGYFVMRGGWDRDAPYLVFDCGPFGYPPLPVHGHADALSFEVYAYGQTLLTDSGVYSYHLGDDWRNYFRGTRAHNTVVVDGQDQSVLVGTRDVVHMARSTLHDWFSNAYFDFVDGAHDGYSRFPQAVTHRRKVFFVKPEYWVVVDLLEGQGEHRFELNFHLMPQSKFALSAENHALHTRNEDGPNILITPLHPETLEAKIITGASEPIQGWISFYSGQKDPAPVLCYSKIARAPTTFQTVLYPCPPGVVPGLEVAPLEVNIRDQQAGIEWVTTGVRLETDEHVDYLVITHDGVACQKAFAGYESDAELVYVRQPKDGSAFSRIMLKQGKTLSYHREPLVNARTPVEALVIVRQDSSLAITSSDRAALWICDPVSKEVWLDGQEIASGQHDGIDLRTPEKYHLHVTGG